MTSYSLSLGKIVTISSDYGQFTGEAIGDLIITVHILAKNYQIVILTVLTSWINLFQMFNFCPFTRNSRLCRAVWSKMQIDLDSSEYPQN